MEIVLVLGMQETYPRGSRKIASEDVVLDLKHNSESVFDVLISHDYLSPLLWFSDGNTRSPLGLDG